MLHLGACRERIAPRGGSNGHELSPGSRRTEDAIDKGHRALLTEEFRILKLARDGYITGPNGAPFGSAGPVIVCGVAARLN
jgi:hypothetical protein